MLNDKERKVIALIEQNVAHSNYFFNRVKDLKWFYPLKEKGFFLPEKIPRSESGDFQFWNILDYLEQVSRQVSQNLQYVKELVDIIESIVQFSLTKKRINNYHIWWYCIKILNNLPPAAIKDKLTIDKFRTWLSAWTDISLGSDITITDVGENLLPKFLQDDFSPDYAYAEIIINAITAIRASVVSNVLTKRAHAVLVWESYWILDAIKKHGQQIGQKCSSNLVLGIADRLRKALEYKQKDHYTDLEIGNDVYRLKVARILADGLKPGDIKFKDDEYECIVKQFSKEQLESVDRVNDFFALHFLDPQDERARFIFTAQKKDSFVAEIGKNLPKDISWQGADRFEKNIISVYEGLYSDYSHIWCRALKSGPANGRGAEDVLTAILKDILLAKCAANNETGRNILDAFLSDQYKFPIFRRFVLLCIDKYWAAYSDLLDKLIEVVPTILEDLDFEMEMQDVLRNHNSAFSTTLRARLKVLIDNVPEYYVKKGDEKLLAYWKYKWLSPLRENPDFSVLYEKEKQKAEPKNGKPYEPERSPIKVGFVSHKSPLSKEDLLQKPVAEIAGYLVNFKGADFWHGSFEGEPDKDGLADVFQAAVKDEPKKFTDELEAFISFDYFYLHRIFLGLKEAWKGGVGIDWQSIFDFSIKYFSRSKDVIIDEALRAQGEDSGKGKYLWIVEAIVDLISDGSMDDARAFAPQYLGKAEQIFDLILPLLKGEKCPDTQRDALTYALNTTLGRTVRAYVTFSLRAARATQKTQENWGRVKFERFLPIGIDGYIWFGCYLPQMKYLDKDYTIEKINFFAKKDFSDFEWQMFMEGYLSGLRIYKDVYALMRPNYVSALQSTVFKGEADKSLVEHICIGYLELGELLAQNNDDGQPSLFWKMLMEAGTPDTRDRWEKVADFFWSISGRTSKKDEKDDKSEPSKDFKKKVLVFWEWTFNEQELARAKLGDGYLSFLSCMAKLTIWLDKIDDTSEKWLMLSAPFINIDHRSSHVIEYLTKFEDVESIKRIGKIFKKILESATPTFRKEEIQLLVERLYKVGKADPEIKADANDICNTYGRRGVHFLKELFYENQQ